MVSMLDCIRRVPVRMDWILENREENFGSLSRCFGERLNKVNELVFVGCGSSYSCSLTARYPAQRLSGLRVTAVVPGEFIHEEAVRNPDALYVFISQSGTSVLTREALRTARDLGLMTVGMSKAKDTPLATEAECFVDMGCAHEEYPMVTIGYSTSVLSLMLLAVTVGKTKGSLTAEREEAFIAQCRKVQEKIPGVIDRTMDWMERERRQMLRSDCLVITGAGALAGVAQEGAVKMWETPQIPTHFFELEESLHAPNYGYRSNRHCVIVLNDGGADSQKARSLAAYMKNERDNGFMVGADVLDEHDIAFEVDGDADCLTFAAVVQTMAYHLAVAQGRDLYAPHDNRVMYSYFDTHGEIAAAKAKK